jgi:hypothetical protein
MQYTHILRLIDADLDRLTKARQILATLDTAQTTIQKRVPRTTVNPKALRTAGRQRSSASALQTGRQEISRRKQATPAPTVQKPSVANHVINQVINQAAAPLAMVPEIAASQSTPVPDPQIRANEPQELRAREESRSAFRETAAPQLVGRAPTRRMRRAPNKPSSKPLERALGAPVSAAPIFIPAVQIYQELQERSQRHAESASEGSASGSTAPVPLTAELLARRWVQGLAS